MTFLIYLNDDYTGGETVFPRINKVIPPEKGKAIIFYNTDVKGNKIDDSEHRGNHVTGTKWICTKWVSSHNPGSV